MDQHTITASGLSVTVKASGAEMCALRLGAEDFLWPAFAPWTRHAPILFPIVGRLKNDTLRHEGQEYRITQHGFVRDRDFSWTARNEADCKLVLVDDAQTRSIYPFPFRLEVSYAIDERGLAISYTVANPGDRPLPASVGAHPAFRYPLREGFAKEAHTLEFEVEEPGFIRGVANGLLREEKLPSPVHDRILKLSPSLFAADALIFETPQSRWVRYSVPGGPTLEVSWSGFKELGIWSRPDADLLCIEPWYGIASPADFEGDFLDKPGIAIIAPGDELTVSHRIKIMT